MEILNAKDFMVAVLGTKCDTPVDSDILAPSVYNYSLDTAVNDFVNDITDFIYKGYEVFVMDNVTGLSFNVSELNVLDLICLAKHSVTTTTDNKLMRTNRFTFVYTKQK